MSTKINPDFYGAENTFVSVTGTGITGNVKTCANTLRQLGYSGTYTGGSLDKSASPWGIGESSLSSSFYCMLLNNGSNRISIKEHFNTKKNSPFFIYENSSGISSQNLGGSEVTGDNLRRVNCKSRLSPEVTFTSSEIQSAISFDNNENIGSSIAGATPVTYYNYNKSRLLADVVYFIRQNSYTIEHDYLVNFLLSPDDFSNVEYVVGVLLEGRFEYGTQGQLPTSGNWINFSPSIGGIEHEIPEFYRTCYYDEENQWVRPDRELLNIGYWKISDYWSLTGLTYDSSPITINESDMQTPQKTFSVSDCTNFFGQISRKNQVFSDVSYHWELKYLWSTSPYTNINDRTELLDGDIMPNAGYIAPICYLVVDDTTYNKPALAYFYAFIHECCFMGLPVIANRYDSTYDIGQSSWIFLPKFDEHLVTTGDFVRSNSSSASELVNYSWGDVFALNMPDYDPDYQPPEPEPEEGDTGDLYNIGSRRFFWNSLNVHLMSVANYDQFIQKLNALNMTDPDNETWQLQFKGLNPSDYIVGAYVSFVKPPKGTSSTIMLGPVDMQQSEYTYKETDSNAGFFSFGTKDILPKFNDFRDYAPYTMIEVYLPLCGTVEVDTAYFMGCSMKIDYYYDIFTMSCVACIYRIKEGQELLYKTVNGTIGAQIPMLSANMGAYQNQIKSIENALKQNELKLMTSTAALAAGVIAAPMTSGTSLIAAGTAAFSGAAGLANSMQKQSELEYQIEHLQPSISVTGAADPQTNLCTGQLMPKIIIKRAKMLTTYNQAEYAKTIGHACCINDILGYVEGDTEAPRSGLVVCSSVDTSGISQNIGDNTYISPTADEINMIKQALSSGVIL